jgi:hypothetical protein
LRRLLPAARDYFDSGRDSVPWIRGREALDELEGLVPDEKDELGDVERRIIEDDITELEKTETTSRALGLPGRYLKGDFATDLDIVWDKLIVGIPPAERILT